MGGINIMKKLFLIFIQNFLIMIMFTTFSPAQITFTGHTIDDNFNGAAGLYACDLDSDGDNDVI